MMSPLAFLAEDLPDLWPSLGELGALIFERDDSNSSSQLSEWLRDFWFDASRRFPFDSWLFGEPASSSLASATGRGEEWPDTDDLLGILSSEELDFLEETFISGESEDFADGWSNAPFSDDLEDEFDFGLSSAFMDAFDRLLDDGDLSSLGRPSGCSSKGFGSLPEDLFFGESWAMSSAEILSPKCLDELWLLGLMLEALPFGESWSTSSAGILTPRGLDES